MPSSASAGTAEQRGALATGKNFLKLLLGPFNGPKMMKGESMNNQNRVLIRRGARELTPTESALVNGGFITFSLCTNSPSPDGDQHVGEVGC